jgi:ketosteroid isomerase-like protein
MTLNLDLVRSIYADWERGDFDGIDWADPQLEIVVVEGPDPGTFVGHDAARHAWRGFLSAWEHYRVAGEDFRELDNGRVLVLDHRSGRGQTSGLELSQIRTQGAHLFHIRDGRVTRLVRYMDRDRALADLGLEG